MNKNPIKKIVVIVAVVLVFVLAIRSTNIGDSVNGMISTYFGGTDRVYEYIEATKDISTNVGEVIVSGTEILIPVEVTFLNMEKITFRTLEMIGVNEYEIINSDGEVVTSMKDANVFCSVSDGVANMQFSVEAEKLVAGNSYALRIDCFEGSKKADAPIGLKGGWECTFTIN